MLHACLFGGLTLSWGETALPPIPGTLTRSLLAYLLTYRGRPHTRDLLGGTFWPDLPEDIGRRRLSQALWRTRAALDPHLILLAEGDTVQINPELPLWVDVEEFEQQARLQTRACLLRAAELYRGDFLAGYYDDWLFPERERLRERFFAVLESLVASAKRQGDYQSALIHARRLAGEDPLREQAHREIMRLCHLLGRDGEALQQFDICRRVLAEELEGEPSFETMALAAEIAERADQVGAVDLPQVAPTRSAFFLDSPRSLEMPLVGREAERAEILVHVEGLFQGVGGVVLIEGEAGVGKTRLLRAIAGDARWRGAEVLWGSARPGEGDAPYGPIVEALSGGLSPLRAGQLAGVVEEIWLEVMATLLPALAATPRHLPAPPVLEPAQERSRLVHALARFLAGWAHVVPLLVVIEDLHWAGQDTLDLLAHLAPLVARSGVLVLGSYRSEEARTQSETWTRLRALDRAGVCRRLVLGRLSAAAAGELVRRCLQMGSPAPLFEARLFAETAGNPLFLLETLRTLYSEGLLFRDDDGRWSTPWDDQTADYAEIPLPPVVEQIIARRLDGLPPSLRSTVELAAVVGEHPDLGLLYAASRREPARLLADLRLLVQHRFLDETEHDYRFHHDKIRQVAYEGIASAERCSLHQRVGNVLERLQPSRAATLAHHWTAAQAWDRAAEYHRRAGDHARDAYANSEAATHYTQALHALARLLPPPDPARVFELRWAREEVNARLGERPGQREDLAALEALAEKLDDDRRRVQVATRQAEYHLDTGDPSTACLCLDRALLLAKAVGDPKIEAWVLTLFGQAHHLAGDVRLVREYNEQALALYDAAGDGARRVKALASCCMACLFSADYLAALEYGRQSMLLCRALGDRVEEGHALHLLSRIHRDLGDLRAARECAIQAVEIVRQVGVRVSEGYHLLELGNLYSTLGDYASARETIEQAAMLFAEVDDGRGHGYALLDLGLVYHRLGCGDWAREHVAHAQELLVAAGDRWGEAGGLTYFALILEGLADLDAAAEHFRQALALKREIDQAGWSQEDLVGLARVALAQGRVDEALDRITHVMDWIERRGVAGIEHPFLVYLAAYHVLAAAGQEVRAQEILVDAYQALMERAAKLDDPHVRHTFLENVAEHRQIVALYLGSRSRTVTVRLPHAGAPTGRPLRDDEYVTVTWTVDTAEDKAMAHGPARRQAQICRLLQEASDQDAVPTVVDLADALGVSAPTVRRDLATLRRMGRHVRTRGTREESGSA